MKREISVQLLILITMYIRISASECAEKWIRKTDFRQGRHVTCEKCPKTLQHERGRLCNIRGLYHQIKEKTAPWRVTVRCPRGSILDLTEGEFTPKTVRSSRVTVIYLFVEDCVIKWTSILALAFRFTLRGITLDRNSRISNGAHENGTYNNETQKARDVYYLKIHGDYDSKENMEKSRTWFPFHSLMPNLKMFVIIGRTGSGKSAMAEISKMKKLRALVLVKSDFAVQTLMDNYEESPTDDNHYMDEILHDLITTHVNSKLSFVRIPFVMAERNCHLSKFPLEIIDENLQILSMSGNKLTNISFPVVKTYHYASLISMDLSNNRIKTFNGFHIFDKIEELDISRNQLETIYAKMCVGLGRLRYLDLSFNKLRSIEVGCFRHMRSLERIDLSNNQIVIFGPWSASATTPLSYVGLRQNLLTEIPLFFWTSHSLEELDLSHNEIKTITLPHDISFDSQSGSLNTKVYLNLSNNGIDLAQTVFNSTRLMELLKRIRMNTKNNRLDCDCRVKDLQSVLRENHLQDLANPSNIFLDRFTCTSPSHLKGKSLLDIPRQDLLCRRQTNCPRSCQCLSSVYENGSSIDVVCGGDRKRVVMPERVPQYCRSLDLSNSYLTGLLGYDYVRHLSMVDLSRANLDEVPDQFVEKLNHAALNLSYNNLKYLPQSITRSKLKYVYLSKNQFVCDCSSAWQIKWMLKSARIIPDLNLIKCYGRFENVSIFEVDINGLCQDYVYLILEICIPVLIILVIAIVIARYARSNRWLLKLWWLKFRHKLRQRGKECAEEDDEKVYDAFLSYSTEDADWMNEIRKRLEHYYKPFNLCIADRDFTCEVPVLEQILDKMYNSRRTVYIVTKDFLKNDRCRFAIEVGTGRYVLSKQDYMVLILFPGVTLQTIQENANGRMGWLEVMVAAGEYLDAEDPHFWERLFLAMPKKRKERPPVYAPCEPVYAPCEENQVWLTSLNSDKAWLINEEMDQACGGDFGVQCDQKV